MKYTSHPTQDHRLLLPAPITSLEGIVFPNYYRSEFCQYRKLDFRVVPLRINYINGKKVPFFPNNWPNRTFEYEDCTSFHNGICIVTGNVSNLMVIDADMPYAEFDKLLGDYGLNLLDYSHCITPSGGVHLYLNNVHRDFWLKVLNRNTLTTTNQILQIDVREANACVFAPGTVIPGYGAYQWVNPPYNFMNMEYTAEHFYDLMIAIYSRDREANTATLPANEYPVYLNDEDDWQKAQRIVGILSNIRINYTDWVKLGMALYAGFGEQGKYLWDYFQNNPNYQDSQRTIDTHWRSFRSVKRISLASLFYVAEKYGIILY